MTKRRSVTLRVIVGCGRPCLDVGDAHSDSAWNLLCRAVVLIPGEGSTVRKHKHGTLAANHGSDREIALEGAMTSHCLKCPVRAFGTARSVPLAMQSLAVACVRHPGRPLHQESTANAAGTDARLEPWEAKWLGRRTSPTPGQRSQGVNRDAKIATIPSRLVVRIFVAP